MLLIENHLDRFSHRDQFCLSYIPAGDRTLQRSTLNDDVFDAEDDSDTEVAGDRLSHFSALHWRLIC